MIHPLTNGKHPNISQYREKYGAITIGFSGWAINRKYGNMMNLDYVIPFSDHCDHQRVTGSCKTMQSPQNIHISWISRRVC